MKVQGRSQDIICIALVEHSFSFKSLRENAHCLFRHSCRIAELAVIRPRVSLRQQHCSDSVEEYFKVTVTIPFLDHLLSDLTNRFATHVKQSASIEKLLPVNINPESTVDGFEQAVAFYADDLPNSDLVDKEFYLWKSRCLSVSKEERPHSISKAMQQCSPTLLHTWNMTPCKAASFFLFSLRLLPKILRILPVIRMRCNSACALHFSALVHL